MRQNCPLFTMSFKLPLIDQLAQTHEQPFPFRSANLHRKCNLLDDALTKRYRARNQFIMARQHLQMLLPGCTMLSQKSRIVSKVRVITHYI